MTDKGSRRDFVKKAAYVAPVLLTMQVKPSKARAGSPGPERDGRDTRDQRDADGTGETGFLSSWFGRR